MFSPKETALERGWPGRIDGDRVTQLAAQTLQAFFTGGGGAREHAEYALGDVLLRAPVLHPPSVRIFAPSGDFVFANPAAIHGLGDVVHVPAGATGIVPVARVAAIIGAEGAIGGYTLMNDWPAQQLTGVKVFDRDVAPGYRRLTPDEYNPADVDFAALSRPRRQNTRLLPGEVIAAWRHATRAGVPATSPKSTCRRSGPLRNPIA